MQEVPGSNPGSPTRIQRSERRQAGLFDLTIKRALYARAEVREYWVIDLKKRCVIVHRELSADRYVSVTALYEGATLTIEGVGAGFAVAKFLP